MPRPRIETQTDMSFYTGSSHVAAHLSRMPRPTPIDYRSMRLPEFVLGPQEIECPMCEWCDARTWLTTIEPYKTDHDKRTFECPECRNVMTEIVNFN